MNLLNYFIKQFAYEEWANRLIFDSLKKISGLEERPLLLFSHLLSAHSMWLSRLKAEQFTTALFQQRTLAECEALMKQNTLAWKNYLNSITETELERVIHFIMPTDGSKRKTRVSDALSHLISHSAYHRGQIVAGIKGKVPELPLTTYVAFASEMDNDRVGN